MTVRDKLYYDNDRNSFILRHRLLLSCSWLKYFNLRDRHCLVWPSYSVQDSPHYECAVTDTGTAFWCHVTLIYLGVSMATVSLVAGGWQSNGTNIQVRVLNETMGPQLEIVQLSRTAGDYQRVCMSIVESDVLSVLHSDSLSAFDSYRLCVCVCWGEGGYFVCVFSLI